MTSSNGPPTALLYRRNQNRQRRPVSAAGPAGNGGRGGSPPMRSYSSYPRKEQPPENVQQVEVVRAGQAHPELVFSIRTIRSRRHFVNARSRHGRRICQHVRWKGFPVSVCAGPSADRRKGGQSPGRPVADATVGLGPWFEVTDLHAKQLDLGPPFGVDEKILAKRFAHTDASGRFSLGDVGANEAGYIEAIYRERQLVGLVRLPDPPRPGSDESPLTIWLSAAGSVSGSAQKDGQPCPGVRVTIQEAPLRVVFGRNENDSKPDYRTGAANEIPPPLASFEDSVATNAQGRFHFATVPADENSRSESNPSRDLVPEKNRRSVRVKAGENTELPPFVFLPTNESLSGIVVDSQGKPVAGATLVAYAGPEMFYVDMLPKTRVKPTGADGRFTMTGLPEDSCCA